MAVSKNSPHRRKSIAVPNQNKPAVLPRAKRRPHSIVPGDRLSPFAKHRRSLAPRKSILKAPTNILYNGDDALDSQSQPHSQPGSQPQSQISSVDTDTTQSMDITRDFHTTLNGNMSRKSFDARRVSFASSVHIRVIDNIAQEKANAAKYSPEQPPQAPTDENAYPGAASGSRRRSSIRHSIAGSEDMDMTSVIPHAFIPVGEGESAIMDEEFDSDDDSMDMTDVIHGDLIQKRSSSIGTRRPLSQVPQPAEHPSSDDHPQSGSFEEESELYSEADSNRSQPMEFTMPLNKSLRPPPEHDEVWLALRQATHSGDTPIEPEVSSDDFENIHMADGGDGMELDDAVQRLMRARQSLPAVPAIPGDGQLQSSFEEDSFEMSEDGHNMDEGDQTMNISKVFGRASDAGLSRMSLGGLESMDESQIYGAIVVPTQSTPRQSLAQPQPRQTSIASPDPALSALGSSVFHLPPPVQTSTVISSAAQQQNHLPAPFTFTPRPPLAPAKSTNTTRPVSPSKDKSNLAKKLASVIPPQISASPNKRPRPTAEDRHHSAQYDPSPVKRMAIGEQLSTSVFRSAPLTAPPSKSPNPKPLSPSKKAPFQAPTVNKPAQASASLRRPSGYFARRKSLGAGLGSQVLNDDEASASTLRPSPKKKAGVGLGRASMGSSDSAAARLRFEEDVVGKGKEKEKEPHCNREVSRQAAASPSLTRGSPAPASPRPASPAPLPAPTAVSQPVNPVVDISTLLGPEGYEDAEAEAEEDVDMQQWRNAVEPSGVGENDEPTLSIKEFFSMTGIKFMDELTAPRRSTHPSQQNMRQARDAEEIPLAEYVLAMGIDVPQLVLYSRVSKDLQAWIEKSKADFSQAEDEAAKITPELFTEYLTADEEGRAELLHQLQLIRTNTRALAKSDWYDWKLQWLEGLRVTADKTFKSLEADARELESIRAIADEVVPALKNEYDEVMRELEKERGEVAEIEASDQEYLNELKASIAEQNIEVEALQAEVAEGKAQLLWLQERRADLDSQKQEVQSAIADAQRVLHIQKNSTRAEVFRLKDELEALEDLHMFRVTKVNHDLFEYVYATQFRVSLPCKNFVPIVKRADVTRIDKTRSKSKDNFPRLSDFLLYMAKELIVREEIRTTRQIVHRLSDYWSSCAQLRSQLTLLTIKYPVEIEISPGSRDTPLGFKAKVMIMFPAQKAKAFISFVFNARTFCSWPMSINTLEYGVEVAYGAINQETILDAVTSRLDQASAADNYACLLDACVEAQVIYT